TLIALALSSPISNTDSVSVAEDALFKRATVTCGSHSYTTKQINAALDQGYSYYSADEEVGSDDYPHTYHNYEGFDFPVDGPYEEFPLLEKGVYTGGSPGADRVIFNTAGELAGEITHTGASSDDGFVGCSGTS
ncbi:ribonuclease-domain-containing protein, partial [Saccharata proteae CBS 121410]